MSHSFRRFLALLAVLSLAVAACSSDDDDEGVATDDSTEPSGDTADDADGGDDTDGDDTGDDADGGDDTGDDTGDDMDGDDMGDGDYTVRNVPADYATIQEAVDAAEEGDLVLIQPGVYTEAVIVEKNNIVIRGVERNTTIIDGEFERENGFIIFGNGVAVENLTSRNNTGNGIFWTGDYDEERILEGYRASYVNALNNGNYGIYAFNATTGQFDNTYGSGSPDSPYYIGQCNPCDAVIYNVIGENSMLGYSGSNSTGVTIVGSEFRNNFMGIVPNSLNSEELAPNEGTFIYGNYVHDNNNPEAPGNNEDFRLGHGTGILAVGIRNSEIARNLITDNDRFGVIVLPWFFDEPDGIRWDPMDNEIRDNVITGDSFGGHLVLALWDTNDGTLGNCFENNEHESTLPEELMDIAACGGEEGSGFEDIGAYIDAFAPGPEYVDYKTVPHAELTFENMADPETAPPVPATPDVVPMDINPDDFGVPEPIAG